MLILKAAFFFLLASLAACGGNSVGTGFPRPSGAPPYLIALGAAADDLGFPGYIITANTGVYRVTWAGGNEFRGSVFTSSGAFGSFFPGCTDGACSLASGEDRVVLGNGDPGRIDFISFPASGKRSGFDVQVGDGTLLVDVLVDGGRNPQLVQFVSGDPQTFNQTVTAPTIPLTLVDR